jgi:Tol biopolymer transport system component
MKQGLLIVAVTAVALAAPAVASADSIVFAKDGNVWLVAPDGSKLTQVTTDGTAAAPYLSPSQADDGTIAVGKGPNIVRLRQNGEVIDQVDPPALTDSVSHPLDGTVVDVALSPDGGKLAYTFASYTCPIGASCGARTATGYLAVGGGTPPAQLSGALYTSKPSWVTNSRTLSSAGYLHQINVHDLGPGTSDVHWFDDQDVMAYPTTDLSDAELTRQGDKVVVLRGYGADTTVFTLKVNGDALSGPVAPFPTPMCITSADPKTASPTWAPDGRRLAFSDSSGVTVTGDHPVDGDGCATWTFKEIVAGGSEPDWGPADVNPQPRVTPPPPAPPVPGPQPPVKKAALTISAAKLKAVLKQGLPVKLTGVSGSQKVSASISKSVARKAGLGRKALTVASGTAKAKADGTVSIRLKFTARAASRLAKLRTVVLTVKVAGGPSRTVTLKR